MMGKPILGLLIAGLLALPIAAKGQDTEAPPRPDRNPARSNARATETAENKQPSLPDDAPTVAWSDSAVARAEAACKKLLAGLTLDYETLPPIKEGLCGAPSPILVRSIGADPEVTIDPPATITCPLAAKLHAWLKDNVQTAAKASLGAPVAKIRNASSYICRNRYGDTDSKISEHALANALDIAEFELASGERITVLDSWPRPFAAEKPPAVGDEGTAKVVKVKQTIPVAAAMPSDNPFMRPQAAGTDVKVIPVAVAKPSDNPFVRAPAPRADVKTNPFVAPVSAPAQAALPAPPPEADLPAPQPLAEPRSVFLRAMHADACKMFGTVLGPEANEAHKDHFHFDMKARRHSAYCE